MSVAQSLKIVLANSYALYLKTQNYHWNVTGPHFSSLHALFEEHYNDLFTANDDIAERVRALGEKVPATFEVFAKDSEIADGNENADAATMVKELAGDQEAIVKIMQSTLKIAQDAGDEVTIGLITDRMTVHEKNAWMLRSSL
ncbi:MAG: DNA starvation/stationary phase protection protein [Rickettsiales bacterium]|nr:DNA starvation/stationary phase protection protein [Rickettsiales bacterium]